MTRKLELSVAVGDYDRTRPLVDGTVQIDGVEPFYGVKKNIKTLDSFLRHHHAQGLSTRRLEVDELFHPTTLETVVY